MGLLEETIHDNLNQLVKRDNLLDKLEYDLKYKLARYCKCYKKHISVEESD